MIVFVVVFVVLCVILYATSSGSMGPSLLKSIQSLINWFFSGLEDIEKDVVIPEPVSPVEENEVFHIHNRIFNYEEAQEFCNAIGVRLATINEVKKAYLLGAQWHTMGWTDGQLGLYILQPEYIRRDPYAGTIGVNGGYFKNPNVRMGINCYGVKPKPDPARIEFSYDELRTEIEGTDDSDAKSDIKGSPEYYKKLMKEGTIIVSPWNYKRWSEFSKRDSRYYTFQEGNDSGSTVEASPGFDPRTSGVGGSANGVSNGSANGVSNGSADGVSNGSANGVSKRSANQSGDMDYSEAISMMQRSYLQGVIDKPLNTNE